MRLVIPIFIVLLGMSSGALVSLLFKNTGNPLKASAVAGGLGAFCGLIMNDLIEELTGGFVNGALLSAILGAIVLSAALNVAMLIANHRSH